MSFGMDLNWEAIGAIAELVGALGVVASLSYLAVQIRHNAHSTSIETERYLNEAWNKALMELASDERIADIVGRGMYDYRSLSQPERAVFHSRVAQVLDHQYTQRRMIGEGVGDPAFADQMDRIAAAVINSPGGKEWWEDVGKWFVHAEDTQNYMSENGKHVPPFTDLSPWNRNR